MSSERQQTKTQEHARTAEWLNDQPREAQPLARVEATAAPGGAEDPTARLLRTLEARNVLIDKLREYAIRATNESDWQDIGGKPWLKGPGAEAAARRCGISMRNTTWEQRPDPDDQNEYTIIYEADFSLAGSPIDVMERAIGTCSSRDRFLVNDLQDDLFGALLKSARTNCKHNGITELLGIRGLTWDDIDKLRGKALDRSKVDRVDFKHGARGGGTSQHAGWTFKFGKENGKTVAEAETKNLEWYRGAFQRDLESPDYQQGGAKHKFRANTEKQLADVEAELARRAAPPPAAKEAAAPAPAGAKTPASNGGAPAAPPARTPYQRICQVALEANLSQAEAKAILTSACGEKKSHEYTDADADGFDAAVDARRGEGSIPS